MQKLRVLVKNGDVTVCLEKQIDFIPSKGLMINHPINAVIDSVLYSNGCYHAELAEVLNPTDPENQIDFMKRMGFVQVDTMGVYVSP